MALFSRPTVRYGLTPEPATPYQRAAQVWDDRIGSARVQAKNWRIMSFGGLGLALCFGGALAWQSVQSRVTPYVVQVLSLIHISEPTRQAEISYAVFCLKK